MSLQGAPRIVETFVSEWDMSQKQYRCVEISSATNDRVQVCSQANLPVFGIVENKPTSGEAARVTLYGYCKAVAAAAITRGSFVVTDATGRVTGASLPGSANVVGLAVATAASGSMVNIILMPHQRTLAP